MNNYKMDLLDLTPEPRHLLSSICSQSSDGHVVPINLGGHSNKHLTTSSGSREDIPAFLSDQVSCCERLCNCCLLSCLFSKQKKIDQIKGPSLAFYFKQKANLQSKYQSDNKNHENSLRYLYLIILNCNLNSTLRSDNWKNIGFSTDDPRDEFREGGYFAVLFLTHCTKQHMEDLQTFIFQPDVSFATIAITLSFYAKLALDFIDCADEAKALRKKNKIKVVTINQLANYINRMRSDDNYLYDLLVSILLHIKEALSAKEIDVTSTIIIKETTVLNQYDEVIKDHFDSLFYLELDTMKESERSSFSSSES